MDQQRIDVLLNFSGIFPGFFEHAVYPLNDVFWRAAEADELGEKIFVG